MSQRRPVVFLYGEYCCLKWHGIIHAGHQVVCENYGNECFFCQNPKSYYLCLQNFHLCLLILNYLYIEMTAF